MIEVISYFVRPLSHSIRLAGNMMAGHAVIKVFAGFAAIAVISPLSVLAITAMYAFEVLVCFIQAYVFTLLTCVYLRDALHPASLKPGSSQRLNCNQNYQFKERRHDWRYRTNGRLHRCWPGFDRYGRRCYRRGQRGRQLPGGRPAQPVGCPGQTANLFIGIAFAEAFGIFSFLVALLLMFAV